MPARGFLWARRAAQIDVALPSGETLPLEVTGGDDVARVKAKVEDATRGRFVATTLQLVLQGIPLRETWQLADIDGLGMFTTVDATLATSDCVDEGKGSEQVC